MKNTPPPTTSTSEQERLLAELVALDRQGRASPGRLAELDACIQKSIDEDDRRLAERIAEIERDHARPKVAQRPSRGRLVMFVGVFIYLLAGVMFEVYLGVNFVFAFTAQYWTAAPWFFLGALALWAGVLFRADARQRLRAQHPSWAKRWLLVFPLTMGSLAVLSVMALPGWAALLGRVSGGSPVEQQARIVSVDSLSKGAKGCDQTAKFLVTDAVVRLCLDGRMAGAAPVEGERVLLVGRASWFGLVVDEIRAAGRRSSLPSRGLLTWTGLWLAARHESAVAA